jgi:catechol 2,3-dioxygenase-like lactoylglutathione lyase family enzyme
MKRFHIHVSVADLAEGVRFYSTLFGSKPAVQREDYAKWMLDDPRINFAISARGHAVGVNHLGFQVENASELVGMREQLQAADAGLVEQNGAACCYARSDKYWVTDPAGIAWETFHTLGQVPVFGEDSPINEQSACCIPIKQSSNAARSSCCAPTTQSDSNSTGNACCT